MRLIIFQPDAAAPAAALPCPAAAAAEVDAAVVLLSLLLLVVSVCPSSRASSGAGRCSTLLHLLQAARSPGSVRNSSSSSLRCSTGWLLTWLR